MGAFCQDSCNSDQVHSLQERITNSVGLKIDCVTFCLTNTWQTVIFYFILLISSNSSILDEKCENYIGTDSRCPQNSDLSVPDSHAKQREDMNQNLTKFKNPYCSLTFSDICVCVMNDIIIYTNNHDI